MRPHIINKSRRIGFGILMIDIGRPCIFAQHRQNFADRHRLFVRDQVSLTDRDWIVQREDNRRNEIFDRKQ